MHALPDPLGEADEVIRRSLMKRRGMFEPDDFDDLRSEVMLRLVRRLEDREAEPIASFPDYVAIVAFHVVDDYVRKRYPDRARLANRIRFTLTRDDRFALWEIGRELVAGLPAWEGRRAIPFSGGMAVDHTDIPGSLLGIFRESGGPLGLHAIVSLFWKPGRPVAAPAPAPAPQMDRTNVGEKLWKEIRDLPLRQRIALLLHLRDDSGESALVHLGVGRDEIAATLGMPDAELAAIWEALPLDDNRIAARLEATRQQVINLRKCARERLARRIARW
ncbi:MAG TPA: hypothetical protein VEK57_14925 [Thermoanaerobaculia bacterium]|nr:hypothetical protein [Thermoanaerobaculia bacterium]